MFQEIGTREQSRRTAKQRERIGECPANFGMVGRYAMKFCWDTFYQVLNN